MTEQPRQGRPDRKKTIRRQRIEERRAKVSEMRMEGMTLRAIAKQLKVSKDTVAKDLEAMAEGWREKQYKNIDGILKRVQDTYDHLRDRAIRME